MANHQPTMRQRADAKKQEQLEAMKLAILDGTLTVRQMTPRERKKADADRAAVARSRAARAKARG